MLVLLYNSTAHELRLVSSGSEGDDWAERPPQSIAPHSIVAFGHGSNRRAPPKASRRVLLPSLRRMGAHKRRAFRSAAHARLFRLACGAEANAVYAVGGPEQLELDQLGTEVPQVTLRWANPFRMPTTLPVRAPMRHTTHSRFHMLPCTRMHGWCRHGVSPAWLVAAGVHGQSYETAATFTLGSSTGVALGSEVVLDRPHGCLAFSVLDDPLATPSHFDSRSLRDGPPLAPGAAHVLELVREIWRSPPTAPTRLLPAGLQVLGRMLHRTTPTVMEVVGALSRRAGLLRAVALRACCGHGMQPPLAPVGFDWALAGSRSATPRADLACVYPYPCLLCTPRTTLSVRSPRSRRSSVHLCCRCLQW